MHGLVALGLHPPQTRIGRFCERMSWRVMRHIDGMVVANRTFHAFPSGFAIRLHRFVAEPMFDVPTQFSSRSVTLLGLARHGSEADGLQRTGYSRIQFPRWAEVATLGSVEVGPRHLPRQQLI